MGLNPIESLRVRRGGVGVGHQRSGSHLRTAHADPVRGAQTGGVLQLIIIGRHRVAGNNRHGAARLNN